MRSFIFSILLVLFTGSLFGQTQEISGVVNEYYKVTGVNTTYVQLDSGTDLSNLHTGDKVMLHQLTGVNVIFPFGLTEAYDPDNWGNAGRYELLSVASVNDGADQVSFTVNLDISKYTNGEKIQLVKIYEADYAEVTNTLTAADWDGEKGGVLAMVIYKKLTLSADIDVSGKGLRGGAPAPDYPGICRNFASDTLYFTPSQTGRAGYKGEGIMPVSFNYTMGHGDMVSGGGGGLGYFGGGGGGSHVGYGGHGGSQREGCDEVYADGGREITRGTGFYGRDRVTLGGGGGSSTEDASYAATAGGDGGGIVIILADTIAGNGNSILSEGESVTTMAVAGGGGGGAGGAVLLDINVYENALNVSVVGGKGGNTGAQNTGAGGGGGGGLLDCAGGTLSPQITWDAHGGDEGESTSTNNILDGGGGTNGEANDTLRLPLNGFLFNSLAGTDTLCEGQTPGIIWGTMPKGGETAYTYTWLQSTDGNTWSVITGADDSLFYEPPSLSQTMYYTRVVQSGGIIDTALTVQIYVYESIAGNSLAIRDTLCYNDSPGVLTAGSLSGGSGSYNYTWESRIESGGWQNRGSTENLPEGNLQETTLYRRIVVSAAVCVDTSNVDTLTVLDTLTGNIFVDPGIDICYGSDAGTLEPDPPAGGDGNFSYQWFESDGISGYTPISGATSTSYVTPVLYDTVYYRREVRYGPTSACTDISNTYPVIVYPAISNNTIDGGSPQHICYDAPLTLQGIAGLGGGSGEGFSYLWEESADNILWNDASGVNENPAYTTSSVTDTVWYRREVRSGDEDQCIDVSDPVLIQLFPQVSGDILSKQDTACSGTTITLEFENLQGVAPWSLSLGIDGISYTETGINTSDGTIDFPVAESGDVSVQELSDDNGCYADLSGNTGTIDLTVYESPSAMPGEDTETCGLSFTLEAELDGEAGYWSGPGTFTDPEDPHSLLTIEDFSGQISHLFEWKEWVWHCRDSATVEITFYEAPEVPVLPEDTELDYTFEYQLDAPVPLGEGAWQQISGPEGGVATFEDSSLNNTLVYFTDYLSGDYGLEWTVINGVCPPVSATTIIMIGEVQLYTGFSPNNDGINDEYIINLSGRGAAELRILDRWGNLVFHWSDPDQIRWDGKNDNGTDLPEGTYFYILIQEGVPYDERGFIELRR